MSRVVEASARLSIYLVFILLLAVGGSANVVTRICAVAIWAACCLVFMFGKGPGTRHVPTVVVAIAALLGAWVYAQTSETIWTWLQAANRTLPLSADIERSTLSLSSADSIQTLSTCLLPLAAFLTTWFAFRHENAIARLVLVMSAVGAIVSVYGIVIYVSGNDWLLFAAKSSYLDNLTAVFVNHNTAANFFGIVLSCITALLCALWRNARRPSGRTSSPSDIPLTASIYSAAWIMTFVALMLTGSRAGAGASLISVFVIVALCAPDRNAEMSGLLSRRILAIGGAAFVLLVLVSLLAGQVMHRLQDSWVDDPRFCIMPGLVRLWLDNWLFGTGLGTFGLAFPPYKDPTCGLPTLWLQAHNFYLEGAITLGVLFPVLTLVVVTLLARIFTTGLKSRRRFKWIPALGVGLLVQQLLHNAIDFPIQNVAIAVIFAILMAACASVSLEYDAARPNSAPRRAEN